MKKLFILNIIFLLSFCLTSAQNSSRYYRNIAGVGISTSSYTTNWYVYEYLTGHYPIHIHNRIQFTAFYERLALFTPGPLEINIRGELQAGFIGGTKEDWLPVSETISDGGMSAGILVLVKTGYPIDFSSSAKLEPQLGAGLMYNYLGSDGKGVGTMYADRTSYQYEYGWGEEVYGLVISFGLAIELEKFIINPEYRFLAAGAATTDWEPWNRNPQDEGPSFEAFTVGFAFKF